MPQPSNPYSFCTLLLNASVTRDQDITVIRNKVAAIELLFEQLGVSEPQVFVDSTFVAWVAGLCLSPIWGRMTRSESNLTDLMATTFGAGIQVQCGQKFVTFAVALMKEISEHPERSPDCARTIELVADAFGNSGLVVKDTLKGRYLLSTPKFEAEASASVKVRLRGKSVKLAA